jgi:hypothetical protein
MQFDHHTCHAATAYFALPYSDCSALVLTADGSGDGTSATVSRGADRGLDRLETTRSATGSLGTFYSFVTRAWIARCFATAPGLKPVGCLACHIRCGRFAIDGTGHPRRTVRSRLSFAMTPPASRR